MANFTYFTDFDLLNLQVSGAYGKITDSQYRVTSLYTSGGIPNAYAVCDGTILIQKVDSNTINLILKPIQPDLSFLDIKYIVYKGIDRNSLFDLNGAIVAYDGVNDLVNQYWLNQNRQIAAGIQGPMELPDARATGINYSASGTAPYIAPDSMSIDDVFILQASDPFQFVNIRRGNMLGKFSGANFGIEIMVDHQPFVHKLGSARNIEHIIEVNTPTATPSEKVINLQAKEEILAYIDPCVLFTAEFEDNLQAKRSTENVFSSYSRADIYNVVLEKTATRGKVYVDIRNEHNHSLNFHQGYSDNVKFRINYSGSFLVKNYYGNGWPLLTLDHSDFIGTPRDSPSLSYNTLEFQLPIGTATILENPNPLIYLSFATTEASFPNTLDDNSKIITPSLDNSDTIPYTAVITLVTANISSTVGFLCNFIMLRLQKRVSDYTTVATSSGFILRDSFAHDNMFMINNLDNSWATGTPSIYAIYNDRYINAPNFSIEHTLAYRDSSGSVAFISFPTTPSNSVPFVSESDLLNTLKSAADLYNESVDVFALNLSALSLPNRPSKNVNVLTGPTNLNPLTNFGPSDTFFWIDLSQAEWTAIVGIKNSTTIQPYSNSTYGITNIIANFLSDFPVYLSLRYIQTRIIPGLQNRPVSDVIFDDYEIIIRGYVFNGTSVEISEINTGIFEEKVTQTGLGTTTVSPPYSPTDAAYTIDGNGTINCIIYLHAASAQLTPNMMNAYRDFVEYSIKMVWNSQTNLGTPRTPFLTTTGNITNIDPSGIQVIVDDPGSPISSLGPNEIFINVILDWPRSYMQGRIGFFNYNWQNFAVNQSNNIPVNGYQFGDDHFMPAHEFGHVLGLADRYTYMAFADHKITRTNSYFALNDFPMYPNYGISLPLYLPNTYDIDYTINYNWAHNLMSSTLPVGEREIRLDRRSDQNASTSIFNRPIYDEPTYRNLYSGFLTPSQPGMRYSQVIIFVTPLQWDICFNNQSEIGATPHLNYDHFVFFKHMEIQGSIRTWERNVNNVIPLDSFVGSFAGRINFPGDTGEILSDHGYQFYRFPPSINDDPNAPNNFDHDMEMRILDWNPPQSFTPTYIPPLEPDHPNYSAPNVGPNPVLKDLHSYFGFSPGEWGAISPNLTDSLRAVFAAQVRYGIIDNISPNLANPEGSNLAFGFNNNILTASSGQALGYLANTSGRSIVDFLTGIVNQPPSGSSQNDLFIQFDNRNIPAQLNSVVNVGSDININDLTDQFLYWGMGDLIPDNGLSTSGIQESNGIRIWRHGIVSFSGKAGSPSTVFKPFMETTNEKIKYIEYPNRDLIIRLIDNGNLP